MRNKTFTQPRMPAKKKAFGQHFLRKDSVVDNMIAKVAIDANTSVLEIGCGDGFLTSAILKQTPCKLLQIYEIDPQWADFVRNKLPDKRLSVKTEDVLKADLTAELEGKKPWVVLANLPYQITFPILFSFLKNKALFNEGVVMVQEEVAQKIVSTGGRTYGKTTLFLQHHFTWELMEKVEPQAFEPAPKVYSRLLYFKPKMQLTEIPDEENFWKFLKICFNTPRQMLRNNLRTSHYPWDKLPEATLKLRAQQMSFDDFLGIWDLFRAG